MKKRVLLVTALLMLTVIFCSGCGKAKEGNFLFKLGLAPYYADGLWGYINIDRKLVIAPQFENAYSFADNGLARVLVGGKYGYIDTTGKYVIEPQFDSASDFYDDGYASVYYQDENGKTHYEIIDETGSVIFSDIA